MGVQHAPAARNFGIRHKLNAAAVKVDPGGGHGNFKADERVRAFNSIRAFLERNHISQ